MQIVVHKMVTELLFVMIILSGAILMKTQVLAEDSLQYSSGQLDNRI